MELLIGPWCFHPILLDDQAKFVSICMSSTIRVLVSTLDNFYIYFSFVMAELLHAQSMRSEAPCVTKFGYVCVQEILVLTKLSACVSTPSCNLRVKLCISSTRAFSW